MGQGDRTSRRVPAPLRNTVFVITLLALACSLPAAEIHSAAARGDLARVQELLARDSGAVNSVDHTGATPLHWASDTGWKPVVELLLSRGANPNARKANGVTPLHVAAGMGRREIVEMLVASGADVNAKDDYGRTALSVSRFRGYTQIVEFLVSRGAIGESAAKPVPNSLPSAESITGRPVAYAKGTVLGVPVNVVYVNMNDPNVHVSAAIAANGIGSGESFGSFVRRVQPTAAINGTFFGKNNWWPIGDIVIKGRLAHSGGMGTGLCIRPGNKVEFVDVQRGRRSDWSAYETVVCSGPRLIRNGEVSIDAIGQGFRDPHVLGRARRMAVGLTHLNRIVLLNTGIACSLTELARVMKRIGCVEAVNFDGGSSIGMHYRGRTIVTPGRSLTNILCVYERGTTDGPGKAGG